MLKIREILTCHCDKCGSTFEVTSEVIGASDKYFQKIRYEGELEDLEKSMEWWGTDKICWDCCETYRPFRLGRRMDDFVFEALKRCKM